VKLSECGKALLGGASEWNAWRSKTPGVLPILKNFDASRIDLKGVDMSGTVLLECNFKGADMFGAVFKQARVIGCDMSDADIPGGDFNGAIITDTNMDGVIAPGLEGSESILVQVKLRSAYLPGATFQSAIFSGLEADNIVLREADMTSILILSGSYVCSNWEKAVLRGAVIISPNMTAAKLDTADASYSRIIDPSAHGADMTDASVAGAEIIHLKGVGLQAMGIKLMRSYAILCNLRGAVLSGFDITDADLSGTDLSGAKRLAAIGEETAIIE
jgi:uncharacterized protein YjbI with pentapeptide repeats